MAIRIKRSSGNTAPTLLESGQLAYAEGSSNGGTLYYGEIGGTVREIAGKKFVDKVNGIEAGAQVNTVTSVFGRTGAVTLSSNDVTTALTFTPENAANKGTANGYASLDSGGKVPSTQLPSYVDDVLEYNNLASFPATGTAGVIYVAQDTNKTYRWSGSTYVEISASPGSTDAVTEGSTNLYYTDARARAAISVTDSGGDGSLSYNNTTGVITYTGPSASDVRAHFSAGTGITITSGVIATTITQYADSNARSAVSATDAGGDGSFSYNNTTGVFTYTGPGTSDYRAAFSAGTGITITDGVVATTITQYADSNARAAISVTDSGGDGSLSYNNTTGVITYTGPSASEVRAHFSGGTAISITNGVVAFTGTQATGNELENVVEDTTPQLGGNLDVNGNSIVSVSNGDIELAPNGTGAVILYSSTVEVGVNNTNVTVTTPGTSDLTLNTNGGTNSGSITIQDGTNGNITIEPNGTGHVHLVANALRLGDLNSEARISTYGTGNLVLTTNEGNDPDPTITIGNGANANITLTPSGTGKVIISSDLQVDGTTTTVNSTTVTVDDPIFTLGGDTAPTTDDNKDRGIEFRWHNGTTAKVGFFGYDDSTGYLTFIPDATNTSEVFSGTQGDIQATNFRGTHIGAVSTDAITGVTTNGAITITPNGTGDVQLVADTVQIGDANTNAVLTTNGTGSLTISTNNGTSSGSILINSGANGNFEFSPAGTGDVYLNSDTVRIGDPNITATLTTNSSGSLVLNTNAGSNSGNITINQGANQNISITPNGTGNVVLDGVNWPQTAGTANYALTTNGSNQASWSQISLTAAVTGTLPLANGGTNAATARDAWDNLTTYTATNSATATLTNASNYIQHIYGGSGTTFTLPSTSTMSFGEGFYFVNNSGQTTTVNTSTSALVGTVPSGSAMRVHVTNTGSNDATSWVEMREFESVTGTGSAVLSTNATITSPTLVDYRDTVFAIGNSGATTLTPNAANGNVQTITATGNFTLSAFSSPVSGQTITFIITQDATGSRTLTSTMKFAGASKTLSTAANAIDILTVSYIGTTYYATLSKGYA